MANKFQFKRGLETNRSGQTPAAGEPLWITDEEKLYIGNGSTAGGVLIGGGSTGGGLTTTSVKTANYTATAGDRVPCDTGGGAFTLTLPSSPTAEDQVGFFDYQGDFGTNKLTIGRNGSKIMGLSENMTVDIDHISVVFEYIDATQGWVMI